MTYELLKSELVNAGYNENVVESNTDFGTSLYFYVNGIKVRVSDHSVENKDRMQNEVHFQIEKYNDAVLFMEKMLFPERFEIIYTGQVINGIKIRQYIRK